MTTARDSPARQDQPGCQDQPIGEDEPARQDAEAGATKLGLVEAEPAALSTQPKPVRPMRPGSPALVRQGGRQLTTMRTALCCCFLLAVASVPGLL